MYTWGAVVALLFIFAGFAPTYYLKNVYGSPEISTLKHIHGLVMTAWFTLFLVQVRLIAAGRTAMHRQLGVAGIALALAYHKRLMLLASLAMLTPAMARLPLEFVKAGGPLAFFACTDLVILACIAFDTVKNRRVHPAFAAGLAFIVVGQIGRLALTKTPFWMPFATWLVG